MWFSKRTPRAGSALARAAVLVLSVLCLLGGASREAAAQFVQQGSKLIGSGAIGPVIELGPVALSADGNTLVVGGPEDNAQTGAAWVFTRSGGVWTQQGPKLVGTGFHGEEQGAAQGASVALSGDGNTLVVGGPADSGGAGAVWVFTQSGGVWTQQGGKLTASDAVNPAEFGISIALSADGNTAIVGGHEDNGGIGAVWVFTRSGGVWTQQGSKLVGNDYVANGGNVLQGYSVALSADGNTLIEGGFADNSGVGAAWVFTQNGGVWTQQGGKLTASDEAGTGFFGNSIALSADGNTALVGGPADNSDVGATWVFTQSGGVWTQQGSKLVGTGYVPPGIGNPYVLQGQSAALSADGNTAIVGGYYDNFGAGAAWVFTRSGGVWTQQGGKLTASDAVNPAGFAYSVAVSADGNTLSAGGLGDNNLIGAAWVFVAPPTISQVTPSSGPPAGGAIVSITGTNFTGVTAVDFGTTAAASFTLNSATSITATSPPGNGTVDVTVTTSGGTSATSAADQFSYIPAVTSISPATGPAAGGTSVTIAGSGFAGTSAVQFGATSATTYTVDSDIQITATSPPGNGTVDVTVTTSGGTSATGVADQFTYVAAPTVTSVAPNSGSFAGGTSVTITGTSFTGATAVKFGGAAAASFTVVNATSITATSPAGSGTVDVTVTTPGGTSPTGAADGFTYTAKLTLTATASSATQVGRFYRQVSAASGGAVPYAYLVSAGSLPAGTTLNAATGVVLGTPTASGAFSYTIQATDSSSPAQTATQPVSGIIAPATLTLVATASATTQVGQAYSQTNAASGGTTPYTYSVSAGTLPAGTTLNTSSGTVSGTPTAAGAFSYTIKATDSGSPTAQTATHVVSGTITPATLTLTATPAATTQVGQSYSQTNVASGGTTPYTYSLFAGTLPAGTTLNVSTGTVSGTPTTAGAFSYAIKATDSGSPTAQTATQVSSGTIAPATLTLVATASATTQVGQAYSQTNAASGGTTPYTYSVFAGTLPAGTTLNASTGTVSGTPTTAGAFSYTIKATDSGSPTAQTATQVSSGTITPATLTLTATAAATTQVGQAYSQTNVASGGTTPYTYAVSVGTLPAGTTLNTSTGTVSGTPTAAGAFSYTIKATDSGSPTAQTATQVVSGTITPATLTLVATAAATTQVGQAYSQTNVASGGTTPYTYSLFAGTLPAGTTLNVSTGTVSGTPTTAGAFSYAIKATDSGSPAQTATQVSSGTIAPATLTLVATASATTQVGQAYSQTNVASGGTTPYTYTVSAGTLPAGTTLNASTGTVSGTPTTAGAFSYSIEATDSGSPTAQTATQVSSGTIAPAILTPTVTGIGPNGGPPAGGTTVTITGTNLTGATAVAFGGTAAAQFAVNSATAITALSPAGAISAVDVTVTTPNGTSATSAADRFTYAAARSTQQGQKLVGSGAADQGTSVALSADGNTAIVGGYADNVNVGAAWIFSRSNGAWSQVGGKLFGSGAVGAAQQGWSVALSGDGNTAIVGGYADNAGIGAAWVFTQSGGVWSQQGVKLVASDEAGAGSFGVAVALSSDGNTAIVGGYADNAGTGAAWIFIRSGGVWTQQGSKLVGTGAVGSAAQGIAVALSGAGNTAIVGGYGDNANNGAAWVFTQSGVVWTQEGSKLVGSGNAGAALQGYAVALSADGNTAVVGGFGDNSDNGAAWIFTQSGGVWTQAGSKLTGTGAVGTARQGFSVALSADASTAAIGGYEDNSFNGAAWVFSQSGGVWTQHGSKLVGAGAVGAAEQGTSVALSANGNTLIEGGAFDNSRAGAAWVFIPNNLVDTHDFNGDGKSDIAWRDTSGAVALWLMNGNAILNSGGLGTVPSSYSIIGQRDFNGDGDADLLWRDTSGDLAMWFMNGLTVASTASLGNVPATWSVYGTADMNGDGIGDILWQDTAGDVAIWFMNGSTISSAAVLGTVPPSSTWSIIGSTTGEILWRDTSGDLALWQVNGSTVQSTALGTVPSNWVVVGVGDFNGDGVSDLLFRDSNSGTVAIWFLNSSGLIQSTASVGVVSPSSTWSIAETGDFNGDGMSDILWTDGSGDVAIWFMNGATIASTAGLGNVGTSWVVQTQNAE
jgi:predicted hotdog family 3-hydroxylacyl-ACP dehydratase